MSAEKLIIAMGQINFQLGDVLGNAKKILEKSIFARDQLNADVILFPELSITGYPPEDLLLRPHLLKRAHLALEFLKKKSDGIYLVVGHPTQSENGLKNTLSVIHNHQVVAQYHKQCLPNYGVFDERRYFISDTSSTVFQVKNISVGLLICEDIWFPEPITQSISHGAEIILCANASPFYKGKPLERINLLKQRIKEHSVPIVYVNAIGAQDEIIFDGGSFSLDKQGELLHQSPFYQENIDCISFQKKSQHIVGLKNNVRPLMAEIESVYEALVLGTHDYITKNKLNGILVGLSGGIDSALTLAIAVDALGKDNVHAVMMPSPYTRTISIDDAEKMAYLLDIRYDVIPIESLMKNYQKIVKPFFLPETQNITQENIQARIRGTLLMALSNTSGKIVLNTSNKSEVAVGYSTLYGDMVGGLSVLKDVTKTMVYALAKYRNQRQFIIPERIIERPPSAELSHDQYDQDSLPSYDILDGIITLYVEHDLSAEDIIAKGFNPEIVHRMIQRIQFNEYKRRQTPPGLKISPRAFGRDWRYPITSQYDATLGVDDL